MKPNGLSRRHAPLALLAGLMALAPATAALAEDDDHIAAREALRRGEILSLTRILAVAQRAEPGDVIEVGGYRLEVICTPGHTPSHLCLWMAEQRTMFTGDHVLFDITPNITFWPNLENSLGSYLSSLRMVRNYPVERALPAHRAVGDFHARVEELLRHHEYRLGECLAVVGEEPGLLPFDIAGRMTWRIRAKNWEEFPVSQKWFAVGECLSHLDLLEREGKVRGEMKDGLVRYYPT